MFALTLQLHHLTTLSFHCLWSYNFTAQ